MVDKLIFNDKVLRSKIFIWFFLYSVMLSLVSAATVDTLPQVCLIELRVSNDLFQLKHRSDKYFSAGFFASVAHEVFDNKLSRPILVGSKESSGNYGLMLSQKGFTPQSLELSTIDYSDRPYCGTFTLHYWRESSHVGRNLNFISFLRVGVSGSPSMVDQVQIGIHKKLDSQLPYGWDNQIGTALILDYYVKVKKHFWPYNGWFKCSVASEVEAGTFIVATATEIATKIGWFNDPLLYHRGLAAKGQQAKRKWQLYLEAGVRSSIVFYDGTLQGGLIAFEDSPHVYGWDDYNHWTPLLTYKFIYSRNRFLFCYSKTLEVGQLTRDELFGYGSFDIVFPF